MDMSPAAGKILGMVMAYAVSSLGLLLAYYNYRKRIIKADTIFTPAARAVIICVVGVAVVVAILTAAAASTEAEGIRGSLAANPLGILLPVFIVGVSVLLTWWLYRHFSKQISSTPPDDRHS